MVEGHQVHRVAAHHRKLLLGKSFVASSPNGRFADAARISGRPLTRVEAHGKNLFYFFKTPSPDPFIVHIHFGMSGRWTELPSSSSVPALPSHRLELLNTAEDLLLRVSAQVLDAGGEEFYDQWRQKLGEDPLRDDADVERVWTKVQATKKPIGLVLMDQSVIAGIGNIYRAEILFKSRLHPNQPSHTVPRDTFDHVWRHSVECLQRGFQTGSILTVDKEDAVRLGPPWTRRYVYNHSKCGECGTGISSWDMGGRTCWACTTCQPLLSSSSDPLSAPTTRPAKVFSSRCARDDGETLSPVKMTVAQLKEQLEKRGAEAKGRKAQLVKLLEGALEAEGGGRGAREESATEEEDDRARATKDGDEAQKEDDEPQEEHDDPKTPKRKDEAPSKEVLKTPKRGRKRSAAAAAEDDETLEIPGESQVADTPIATPSRKRTKTKPRVASKTMEDEAVLEESIQPGEPVRFASAREAAREKEKAGEGRNVEHVSWVEVGSDK